MSRSLLRVKETELFRPGWWRVVGLDICFVCRVLEGGRITWFRMYTLQFNGFRIEVVRVCNSDYCGRESWVQSVTCVC